MTAKILVSFGSLCTAAFGVWHFFVPDQWDWYAYISPQGTRKLVLAVRAINVFFSLSLVLIGIANPAHHVFFARAFPACGHVCTIQLIVGGTVRFSRSLAPQGSANPSLQYGMLVSFLAIFSCFLVSLLLTVFGKTPVA